MRVNTRYINSTRGTYILWSYRRRLGSLLLYLCYVFWPLINSLVCRFCFRTNYWFWVQFKILSRQWRLAGFDRRKHRQVPQLAGYLQPLWSYHSAPRTTCDNATVRVPQALRAGRASPGGTALTKPQQQWDSLILETVRALFIHVCQQSLPPILITYMPRGLVHRARDTTATSRYVAYISFFTVQLLLMCRSVAWHRKVTCIVASHYKSGFSNLSRVWISLATGLLLQLSVPVWTGQTTCTELHWLCSARFHAGTNRPNNLQWAPLTLLCPFPCRCEQGKYLQCWTMPCPCEQAK